MPTTFRMPSLILLSSFSILASAALNPNCAPGGNFDLSKWTLQLPTGSAGSPTQISSSALKGCSGYQDSAHKYFFTEAGDGALVMNVPGSPSSAGCVTTPNSLHCRTELRESSPSSWSPNSPTNKLSATLTVVQADDSNYGTVIGQIHIDDSVSTKPVGELYCNKAGVITMSVEKTRAGGSSIYTKIGTVTIGQKFSYTISYQGNVLSVGLNGSTPKVLSTNDLNAPASYFKAGNYNQGNSPSSVHFFAISTEH